MEMHEWRVKTKEETRYFRATHHAGSWRFQTTLKTDPEWETLVVVPLDLWVELRDILWRRYQRKKCAWEVIEKLDKMLEKDYDYQAP